MIREYFELSKKEFNGIVVLCMILVIVAFTPEIYSLFSKEDQYDYSKFNREIDEFLASEEKPRKWQRNSPAASALKLKPQYFVFNPNNLPDEKWLKLGLSEKQIRVIKNYESKGGKFYRPEDLEKIYSISEEDYKRLRPYISIPQRQFNKKGNFSGGSSGRSWPGRAVPVMVELNAADSVQLESLKGIGPSFAARILKYRKRIGGFVRKEQLLEVFGMDSVRYEGLKAQIAVNPESISKVDINKADFDQLKRFPYLSYKQINAIVQYRKQHGNYSSVADLKRVLILNDEVIEKVAPYLEFK